MWFLALIVLINTLANNKTFVLEYRISIAGMPINIFDALMVLGVFLSVLPLARNREIPEKVHRAFTWLMMLCLLTAVVGFLAGVMNDTWDYQLIAATRNWLAIPVGLLLGYRFIP